MAYEYTNVTLRGFHFEDFHLTGLLSGAVTIADVGKAIALDATAPNTFKLAGDGDIIVGRLASFEDRVTEGTGKMGAIAFKFALTLPIADASGVAVGDTVIGAGDGEVKPALTNDPNVNFVAEIIGTLAVVVKL